MSSLLCVAMARLYDRNNTRKGRLRSKNGFQEILVHFGGEGMAELVVAVIYGEGSSHHGRPERRTYRLELYQDNLQRPSPRNISTSQVLCTEVVGHDPLRDQTTLSLGLHIRYPAKQIFHYNS